MTGYRPDLEFLASLGIRLDPESQKPRINPETLESDRPGIFLAGVIVAGMHTNEIFIENGRFHGKQIAEPSPIRLRLAIDIIDLMTRRDFAKLAAAACGSPGPRRHRFQIQRRDDRRANLQLSRPFLRSTIASPP